MFRRLAPLLAMLVACGQEPRVETTAPLVCGTPPPRTGVTYSGLGERPPGPTIVYLNRCLGDCALTQGVDDARQNSSVIVDRDITMPAFTGSDETWNAFVDCVTRKYMPFEVVITDVDPGDVPHFENIVSGRPELIGVDESVAGIAPSACAYALNAISFTFAELSADDPKGLCNTAAHELGHTFGLEHEMLCNDPMTYLRPCGEEKEFQRVDARCGEHSPIACQCGGGNYQNSYLWLLDVLGPRVTRANLRPLIRIASPSRERVEPEFRIFIEAEDDGAIAQVRVRVEGVEVGTATVAPYVFRAPAGLAAGDILIEADATDDEGVRVSVSATVALYFPTLFPDASIPDIDNGDRPEIIGLHDGGVEEDSGQLQTIAESGCTCVTPRGHPSVLGLLLIAGLALRRRALAWVALAFFAACQDEGALGRASGSLVLDPPPGTQLTFDPLVLTKDVERRIKIVATNVGNAPLEIGDVHFTGLEAPSFSVLTGPGIILPGKSKNIWVVFTPTWALDTNVTLHVPSTDAAHLDSAYPVRGIARAPCQLFATPRRQFFGDFDEREISVEAAGLSDCTITRLSLADDILQIVDAPEVPFTIPAGTAVTLRIRQFRRTEEPGNPVRTLFVFEADGSDARVELVARAPIWNCVEISPDPRAERPPNEPPPHIDLKFEHGETERRIVLTNRCSHEIPNLKSAIVGMGWESYAVEPLAFPVALLPGRSVVLKVKLLPGGGGFGEVHVSTDDAAFPQFTLKMIGDRQPVPHVYVLPTMDFGLIPDRSCLSRVRAVRVFNFGETQVLARVALSGDPSFELLSIDGTLDPALPFQIPPSSSRDVMIEVQPSPGPRVLRGRLAVKIGVSEMSVALRAEVVADGPAEDRFTLDIAQKSDTLFVIDDSASADRLRQQLRDALPSFVDPAYDQRIAATLADPEGGAPSRCLDFDPYLESSLLGPVALLRGLICITSPLGPPPPRSVGGIGAAIRFMESEQFVRDGARLSVVMVSDDDDVSPGSPALAARFFEALHGPDRPDLVAVHDLTPQNPASCPQRFAQRGVRYQALTQATGGLSAEACAPDLGGALTALSAFDHRMVDTFALSRAADPAQLTVLVNDVPVTLDALDGYTFDGRTNTVTLHGASATPRGASVKVRYTPECSPPRTP